MLKFHILLDYYNNLSFQEKLASLMARPQDSQQQDDVPWYMKYAGRGLGTVGSVCKFNILLSICLNYLYFYQYKKLIELIN